MTVSRRLRQLHLLPAALAAAAGTRDAEREWLCLGPAAARDARGTRGEYHADGEDLARDDGV